MDVVGYSKLLLDEQRELQQLIGEIVRNTEQVRSAEAIGKLLRLPVGDGMALVSSIAWKHQLNARWRSAKR